MTSNTSINESISALIDDESNDLDLKRVLRDVESDNTASSTWSRYQMIGSVMRKEQVSLQAVSFADRISAAIDEQDTTLSASPSVWRNWGSGLGKMAVAATVALGLVVGFDTLDNTKNGVDSAVAQNSGLSAQLNDTIPAGFQLPNLSAKTVSTGAASPLPFNQNPLKYNPSANQSAATPVMTAKQSADLQILLGQLMQAHVEQSAEAGAFGVLPMARLSNTVSQPSESTK